MGVVEGEEVKSASGMANVTIAVAPDDVFLAKPFDKKNANVTAGMFFLHFVNFRRKVSVWNVFCVKPFGNKEDNGTAGIHPPVSLFKVTRYIIHNSLPQCTCTKYSRILCKG